MCVCWSNIFAELAFVVVFFLFLLVNIKNYTIVNWRQQYKLNEFQKQAKKRFKAYAKRSTNHKDIKPTTTCNERVSNFEQQ